MRDGQVAERIGGQIVTDDLDVRMQGLLGSDDRGGEFTADRIVAEDAGVEMEKFHGAYPLI
jgi:hypothetical protein